MFGWFRPTEEKRIARARKFLANGEHVYALDQLEGLDGAEAATVRSEARAALVSLNCKEAVAFARAGSFSRSGEHLELASRFADRGSSEIRAARREVRELRQAAKNAPKGLALANDPAILDPETEADPLFSLPPDDPRVAFAMALEAYPEELRDRLIGLGADFASAVGLIESGQPALAVERLGAYVHQEPVVRYERARAAQAEGNLALAVSDLKTFGAEVGHTRIGRVDTGALLVQLLLATGRREEALENAVGDSLAVQGSRAMALESLGRLEEADKLAAQLVKKAPRDLGLYKIMARCRIKADKRIEAMQVLEKGLSSNCNTGRCGSQAFDAEAGRMLAQLYLEDRLDDVRAAELVGQVKANVRQTGPVDAYLDALTLRNAGDPAADELAGRVLRSTRAGSGLAKAVQKAFPSLAPAQLG